MRVRRGILGVLVLAVLLSSCSGRQRIIPRATLTDIYAEMMLADQWLSDHSEARTTADTTLFYDPIFKRYGYTFEDYDASVRHYLKDPEKFAKIFKNASLKLKNGRDEFRKKVERLEMINEFNASIKGYSASDFAKDTLIWRSHYKDSIRHADSLMKDSLYRDSLIRDSLLRDSLRLDSLRLDSLHKDLRIKNILVDKFPKKQINNELSGEIRVQP